MFLPTTQQEVKSFGWESLDIILITGDSYIDSPYIGVALLGNLLYKHGYRVGIIAQPDISSGDDITRLGEPELFWGISGGSVDSMVANYTATKKKRKQDDYTPGGINNKRPDRATIVYSNLIRRYYKNTRPLVLGGIEASLRRVTHYDFWSDKLRRSILFDAKADYLVYGMGEKAIIELADKIKQQKPADFVKGVCYISKTAIPDYIQIPSHEECVRSKNSFTHMFHTFYQNNDPMTAKGLVQQTGDRFLVQNPPQPNPTVREIDSWYDLDYQRKAHPYYEQQGEIRALDTIRFSINSHRGCYGECNFCAIAVHQGITITSRSQKSILNEAKQFVKHEHFKGIISDVGGPTANMYGFECGKKLTSGACKDKRCVFPDTCKTLKPDHSKQIDVLQKLEKLEGINKVFVASGIRTDLVVDDFKSGKSYLKRVTGKHTSGQMKIAPEHTDPNVLDLMGKQDNGSLEKFHDMFYAHSKNVGKQQYLTFYFIAAHPGCRDDHMDHLKNYASQKLRILPEQVQIFTPTPSTYSTLMYYTQMHPFTGEKLFVEKDGGRKSRQKKIVTDRYDNRKYKDKAPAQKRGFDKKRPLKSKRKSSAKHRTRKQR